MGCRRRKENGEKNVVMEIPLEQRDSLSCINTFCLFVLSWNKLTAQHLTDPLIVNLLQEKHQQTS